MDVEKEYFKLKKLILERTPKSFTAGNDRIIEKEYEPFGMPNFNPYRLGGHYYPTFCQYRLRSDENATLAYKPTKGEEETILMWSAMLRHKEYEFLADLFILGFLHDCLRGEDRYMKSGLSIAGRLYEYEDIKALIDKAADIMMEIITDAYGNICYIINRPSISSCQRADLLHKRATDRFFDEMMRRAEELHSKRQQEQESES